MLDVTQIMVPIGECIAHSIGEVSGETISQLTDANFDHAPVLNEGAVVGLLATEDAKHLSRNREPLETSSRYLHRTSVPDCCGLEVLLAALANSHAVLVTGNSDSREVTGMVTISDLNRHSFRSAIYPILAKLEVLLANHLEEAYADPWGWLPRLSEHSLAPLLGAWELQRRNRLDVSPVVNLNLSQLLNLFGKDPLLRSALGERKKRPVDDAANELTKLRNKIMHPVRSLVLSSEDAAVLRGTIRKAEALIATLEEGRKS